MTISRILTSLLPNEHDRKLKRLTKQAQSIIQKSINGHNGLDSKIPIENAFAQYRRIAGETLGMKHYPVQIAGGLSIANGEIAEMQTGEGKTLTATCPAAYMASNGNKVYVITANDYLAKRDFQDMKPFYDKLEIDTFCIDKDTPSDERVIAHQSPGIIYTTCNEIIFDYLKTNIGNNPKSHFKLRLDFAIIDEIDAILIDNARIPFEISGDNDIQTDLIEFAEKHVHSFKTELTYKEDQSTIDALRLKCDAISFPTRKKVELTDSGFQKLEVLAVERSLIHESSQLYSQDNLKIIKAIETSIQAHNLYHANVDYIIKDNGIQIINQSTGRIIPGQRWGGGLHQALEKKENLPIESDSQTIASISIQNFFRKFRILSGMTGTADTEAFELKETYNLDVMVIPPNIANRRIENEDLIYMSKSAKMNGIIEHIVSESKSGRPILIGTESVTESQMIFKMLEEKGIKSNLLNALNPEEEALIISKAGEPHAITISTNMAGRGTDIVLSKAKYFNASITVAEAGGLHVIGTNRHLSRRTDNQLKGRSARQGDPGSSQFFVSFEDELMTSFAPQGSINFIQRLKLPETDSFHHPLITKAIIKAQTLSEGQSHNARKDTLKYDDITNEQRDQIYHIRHEWLTIQNSSEFLERITILLQHSLWEHISAAFIPPEMFQEEWDLRGFDKVICEQWGVEPFADMLIKPTIEDIEDKLKSAIKNKILDHAHSLTPHRFQTISVGTLVALLDHFWIQQIASLSTIRDGIHLRGYAQKQPLQEFNLEANKSFNTMVESFTAEIPFALKQTWLGMEDQIAADIEHASERT
ncbi:DEAD/DEAH box helicase [Vibrio splendidus]